MRHCSGSPCSAYLVLRSCDVPPAASTAISSGRFRHPVPVSSGRTRAGTGGKFKHFKKTVIFL
ncbi:unnamed protein product [Staurois parvus]|uniref:Uncharacterized protein n=1 Tax=Staurois parvus TaxID=386267 RepID=A0ABN9ANF9_9NEOB|nr:unnamed protein product [Staurois parvus]